MRSDDPGLCGVARSQRLLRDGTSALYGQEVDVLPQGAGSAGDREAPGRGLVRIGEELER
jgi:hypothetical protein